MQYSLPSERKRINKLIEGAIYMAEKEGVRVITLGTLNKVSHANSMIGENRQLVTDKPVESEK